MDVRITEPHTRRRVTSREITVRGTAITPDPIQVYVRANDSRWYLQREVTFDGLDWSVDCILGDYKVKNEHMKFQKYAIVALLTPDRPETPLESLPSDVVRSNKVVAHLQIRG